MKKVLFTLALLLTCQFSIGQTFEEFVNEFKNVEGVMYTPVNKETIAMIAKAAASQGGEEAKSASEFFSKMDNIEMIICTNNKEIADKIYEKAIAMTDKNYEKGIEDSNDDYQATVNFKKDGDNIVEMVAIVKEAKEANTVIVTQMKGKFEEADLQNALQQGGGM